MNVSAMRTIHLIIKLVFESFEPIFIFIHKYTLCIIKTSKMR